MLYGFFWYDPSANCEADRIKHVKMSIRKKVSFHGLNIGMQSLEMYSWYGFWGLKTLPADIVAVLESVVRAAATAPRFKEHLNALGFEQTLFTPWRGE